jgi:hypothetical protein
VATTGFKFPTVGAQNISGTVIWSNPENITADDTSYAGCSLAAFEDSWDLVGDVFGFSAFISAGSTIDGITVRVVDYSEDGSTAAWKSVYLQLADGSEATSENKATELTTIGIGAETSDAGGAADLWSETITRADVVDVDWGVRLTVQNANGLSGVLINAIQMDIAYTAESVTASGTITTADEQDIIDGGVTILLDLTGVTWVAAGATFDAQRQNIIDGIEVEPNLNVLGWQNEVAQNMDVSRVVRTSNTRVTITLNAAECADYKIIADEILTATIPATAHSGSGALGDGFFATITALCDQTLPPTVIDTQTNLTGAVTDIDESVDSPDGNWLVLA